MKGIPQGRYTKEFREEAVKAGNRGETIIVRGRPPVVVGADKDWELVKAFKAGNLGEIGKTYRPLTEVEMELTRTKKELVEVKMGRDILKKAAAYFLW